MTAPTTATPAVTDKEELDHVTIRFAGDSGDGVQLTGAEFARASAVAGNDIRTFPDYPAEIRAPAGTVAGVSGFQIQFSHSPIFTPGDSPDVLVAMNPASLKANMKDLMPNGMIVANMGAFTPANLEKAGYATNPLEDGSLDGYRVHPVDISRLTTVALTGSGLSTKDVARARAMYALGIMLYLYDRPMETTTRFLMNKFASKAGIGEANVRALKAGYAYGESQEMGATYRVLPAEIRPGTYRNLSGNEATALGLLAATEMAGIKGFLGSYPITPASEILHELAKHKQFGFITFQAEDEIAAICSAIGAAYGGSLACTTTSGPGVALKTEAIGLAVMAELPLVIVNVQRGGPSTGLPTKTEQADLMQAIYGRNGESPVPVIAARSPSDCFDCALEAARIAIEHMTPVFLLTDGYLGNGQEPWRVPEKGELKPINAKFRTEKDGFFPYMRDENGVRPWVKPGTPGLEHRIGGLEKDYVTGNVSYDAANHERMCRARGDKVARIAHGYAPLVVDGPNDAEVLVLGWGSTYGAIRQAIARLRAKGRRVAQLHLRNLWPLPDDLGPILKRYPKILVPEMNLGQLVELVRARFLVDAHGINKVQGQPFRVAELAARIEADMAPARSVGPEIGSAQ